MRVLGVLASAGIQPVLLKGVPLGHLLYDTPSLRPHNDTDLIVPRDQIRAVRVALQRMGYVESTMSAGELSDQFDVSKPTMSAHFAVLRDADLVHAEKAGKSVIYHLKLSVLEDALLGFAGTFGWSVRGERERTPARGRVPPGRRTVKGGA